MGRAPCCDKANVKKGSWSPEEDAKLKSYIEKCGTGGNWITLPRRIGLKRCGKSCRLRWLNYLRPDIKHGGFSEEEDNIICNMYTTIGSRKFSVLWSTIATQLPGRTDNDIKNYWNTKLKKKILSKQRNEQNLARMISALKQEPVKKLAEDLKLNNPVYSPNLVRFGGMYLNDFLIHTDQEHVYECSNVSLSSINGGSSSVETAYNMGHFDINYNRFFVEFQDKINESAFFNSEHIVRDSDWSNPFEIMNYLVSPTQLYNQEAVQVESVVEDAPIESIVAFPEL